MDIHNDKTLYKLLLTIGAVFGLAISGLLALQNLKIGLFSLWVIFCCAIMIVYIAKSIDKPPLNQKTKSSTVAFFSYFIDVEFYKLRVIFLTVILVFLSIGVWKFLDKNFTKEEPSTTLNSIVTSEY